VWGALRGAQSAALSHNKIPAADGNRRAGDESEGRAPDHDVGKIIDALRWRSGALSQIDIDPANHIFLQDKSYTFINNGVAGAAGTLFGTDRISQDVDLVTVRVNYRFGGPVVARY
jgi:hypothetical protein